MSMKTFTVVGGLLMALGFFAGSLQGCGSSAADNKALCKSGCEKTLMCHPEYAAFLTEAACEMQCATMMGTSSQPCKNQSEMIAKFNECLKIACGDAFDACTKDIPKCVGGGSGTGGTGGSTTGTGGKGGTGGSITGSGGSITGSGGSTTGSGGSGSDAATAAGCETCTKADACCMAVGGGANCQFAASCTASMGANRDQLVMACQGLLTSSASNPSAPAACK